MIDLPGLTFERASARQSYKWKHYPPDVLPAHVADMDFDPAPEILDVVRGFLDRGDLGYNFYLVPEMFDAFAAWQSRHHGWEPDIERIRSFTSVLHAVESTLSLATEPGDGVILFVPSYHPFFESITGGGRRCIEVPLDRDGWRIDADELEAAIDDTTKAILFCHPHNPTGRIFDQEELAAVADAAERHDLLVISDEIWGDITHENTHVPLAIADDRFAGRLVTTSSASKSFNVAGLHCCVSHTDNERLNRAFDALAPRALGTSTPMGFAAAVTAWTHCQDWLDAVSAQLTRNRDHLASRLAAEAPAVRFDVPQATYLAWLDFSATPIADDPAGHNLERGRLGLDPGAVFGAGYESFARCNLATTPEILDDAIDRMLKTL